MKKLMCILCAAVLFLLTGCTETIDEVINNTRSPEEIEEQESYIWEKVPSYTEVSESDEANADDLLKKVIETENGISSIEDIFTDKVRDEMVNIINEWYNNKFYTVKHIEKEEMTKLEVKNYETSVVYCDGIPMIKMYFTTSATKVIAGTEDSLNALIDVSGEEYSVYEMWYEGKYRYGTVF